MEKIIFSLALLISTISLAEPIVLSNELEPLDERITTQSNNVETLNTATNILNTSILNLNDATNTLNTSISNLNYSTNYLNTAVSSLNTATNTLNTELSKVKWATQNVYVGIDYNATYNVDYHDGDVIQLQSENGSIQFFSKGNGGSASITLVLPEKSIIYDYGSLTLFVESSTDTFIKYYISETNCYASWWPTSQPWDTFEIDSTWKTKWESPPGENKWYFMGAEKFPW